MGRKARLKRERRSGGAVKDAAREIRRALEASGLGSPLVLDTAPDERKLSDALLEVVRPLLVRLHPSQQTKSRVEQIVTLGTLAWNAYLMPSPEDFVAEALGRLLVHNDDVLAAGTAASLVRELLERRGALHPDDRRYVVKTLVTMKDDGRFDLSAAYAPFPVSP